MQNPQPSPRTARRIASSRASVRQAAWELAQERPWSEVTVAAICERADVAPRTFSRYFPDKVEVLFADAADHEAHLRAAMNRHRLDPGAPQRYLAAVLDDMAEHLEEYGADALAARRRIIGSSPELAARELVKRDRLLEIGTQCLAEKLGESDPYRAPMLAALALHACFTAMNHWAQDGGDLRAHLHQALAAGALVPSSTDNP